MHGLAAKAHLDLGDLEAALGELAHVHDVGAKQRAPYDAYVEPGTLELWLDIARIHAAHRHHELAMTPYNLPRHAFKMENRYSMRCGFIPAATPQLHGYAATRCHG